MEWSQLLRELLADAEKIDKAAEKGVGGFEDAVIKRDQKRKKKAGRLDIKENRLQCVHVHHLWLLPQIARD